MTLKEESSKF